MELQYENSVHYFWTDSQVVLGYIANDSKRFHVFVANRVQQIRDCTDTSQWRYVASNDNPADIASRGSTAAELMNSSWFTGPEFLWQLELPAVSVEPVSCEIMTNDPEVKEAQCFVSSTSTDQHASVLERLEYFSDWSRAKRAVAVCLVFGYMLKHRLIKKPQKTSSVVQEPTMSNYKRPSVDDMHHAEIAILKNVQARNFPKEVRALEQGSLVADSLGKPTINKESSLYRLDPFLDKDGLIRVGGRLQNSSDGLTSTHPVILPRKGHITELLIRHFHERVQHQGRGMTTNELRCNGYWVIGCSSAVSDMIFHCVTCRKLRGRLQDQKMANLPVDRVDPAPPFSYCGVDCFGPFLVKERRKTLKRYGVLFTCFTSRAIHLEIANSLETDSFINALRRFLALRGPIRQLRSDRGTNFIGAERELRDAVSEMDDDRIAKYLLEEGCDFIKFKPNVPSASHMGGVWERQIRTVRNVLASLLHQCGDQLDDESLRTLICEVTAIVNSRPLSVECLNDPLSQSPLTPNHLLTMKSRVLLPPPGHFARPDLYARKRWRRVQYLANQFWNRWRKEYLSGLQSRSKWVSARRNMMVNDIVMVKDENLPRNRWRLAQVEQAVPEEDGLVRKVRVKTLTNSVDSKGRLASTITELERPVHKLVLLKEASE